MRVGFEPQACLLSTACCSDMHHDAPLHVGKSRGFGFVTFLEPSSAQHALGAEHTIDGRRCEAKVALPKVCTLCDAFPLPAAM
jgi:RNA recognition motif-containing protein